jgi:hypothetical protein
MEKANRYRKRFEENNERLKLIYVKAIVPKQVCVEKGFIICPECGEELLIDSNLRLMNDLIENHVEVHREELGADGFLRYIKPINIRLDLTQQTLHQLSFS